MTTCPVTEPLVSIVTPSFNQAAFIEETIRSVLEQDYPHIEYIVIDGGSTDGSVDIIRRYADRLAYWVSERDAGQSDAINKGLRRANGEILAWLNSDDYYVPHAISTAVEFLVQHPDLGMAYGDVDGIDADGHLFKLSVGGAYDWRRQLLQQMFVPQPAAFWRRRVTDRLGYLRTDLHYGMDWDLWLRLGRCYSVGYIERTLARFRITNVNKTTAHADRFVTDAIRVLDDLYAVLDLPADIRALKDAAYSATYLVIGVNGALGAYDLANAWRWLLKATRRYPRIVLRGDWWWALARAVAGGRTMRTVRRVRAATRRKHGIRVTYRDDGTAAAS